VDLWATDEVHFQQYGSRCRMWIPPEQKDPVLVHCPTRKAVGYYGAVRLRDGKFIYRREEELFNGEGFWHFMLTLRQKGQQSSGRQIVVITDNARYHHARRHKEWRQQVCREFKLEFLPPYSPELNPIERVWKQTRRSCLHNRYFPYLSDVIKAVENQFAQWFRPNNVLRRLCAI
jgi:transposase